MTSFEASIETKKCSMLASASRHYFRGSYLDAQATSILDPRVFDAMAPYFVLAHGNSHSHHGFGQEAESAVEHAREQVASFIHCRPNDIIFTSGATESNNIVLRGAIKHLRPKGKNHIIVSNIEHMSVLETAKELQKQGVDVTYLKVKRDGLIDLNELKKSIRPDTALCSIMSVNNEIGVIQDIPSISRLCKQYGVWVHTDVAQSFGKVPLDVNKSGIDFLSLSAHKIHGPKGIGALYIADRPELKLEPVIYGGMQERGLRSGTLAVPLIAGLGKAAEIAEKEMKWDTPYIESLGRALLAEIRKRIPGTTLNGSETSRWFGCLNLSFAGHRGDLLMDKFPEIALSSGSACHPDGVKASYVLEAIGVHQVPLRIGISKFTTKQDVDHLIDRLEWAMSQ